VQRDVGLFRRLAGTFRRHGGWPVIAPEEACMAGLRVLYIDDEPDIREIVELSLGLDPRILVRSCASGDAALALAPDWAPDIILCDVVMPDMDGPATLARMRQCPQTADIPFVFMTSRAQAHEIKHFKSLGAAGIILKPFDPMTLADSVRSHLRQAGRLTDIPRSEAINEPQAPQLRREAAFDRINGRGFRSAVG
jgi:CheY-like chemotaxis protein